MPRRRARTIIITGASAGVGRAIAKRFGEAGDRVGLIARDEEALRGVQRELQGRFAHAEYEAVDVADAPALFEAAERLEQRLGPVDIWINDAMETVFSTVADITPEEFHRVTEVTYLGFVHGTMAALRSMPARRRPDHPDRLGARLSRNSAAGGLLRRQASDPRLHRLAARRTDA
jgi:NAD(P)-dependent dehydrogenase (short-subunit alcohol dehydrogenase family)